MMVSAFVKKEHFYFIANRSIVFAATIIPFWFWPQIQAQFYTEVKKKGTHA